MGEAAEATDDVVLVECWDIVDKGKPRIVDTGVRSPVQVPLKPAGTKTKDASMTIQDPTKTVLPPLDATTVDVYKGTHAVVVMIDPCKEWTFDYAVKVSRFERFT